MLEVKGDLCGQLQRILKWCGRERDYVEVSLDGDIRYNPLNNSLDPYAQAFNIASIITSIWGKGREPFWQQSYTDLVRYVIMLHRIRDGYLTMVDLFRTVISAGRLEEMLTEVGSRFSTVSYIGVSKKEYREHESLLSPLGFEWNKDARLYLVVWTEQLEHLLVEQTSAEFGVYTRKPYMPEQRDRFDSVHYWYWEHWKFFRSEVKTSIIQGIVVFCLCSKPIPMCAASSARPGNSMRASRVLPIHEAACCRRSMRLIESGRVVGLNFPVALNPALAKTIGTMMKIDYQAGRDAAHPQDGYASGKTLPSHRVHLR